MFSFKSYCGILKSFILIISLSSFSISSAQSPNKWVVVQKTKKGYAYGLRQGYGVIVPHRESMIHLVTGHVASTEFFIENCGMKRKWNSLYSYPTNGVNLYFAYLANPDVLGNVYSIDYFSNIHFIKKEKSRFLFDLRLAAGLGYLTKIFEPDINNHNVAIGSHLNISIGASFDFKWLLKNNWQIGTGLSLKHFSNGSFSTPNLGINIPVIMLTAKKLINRNRTEYNQRDTAYFNRWKKTAEPLARHTDIAATFAYGAKEIYPAGGSKYGIYSFELSANWHPKLKYALIGGIDIMHNVALYQHAIRYDTIFNGTQKDITQIGLNIGYSQVFDHFELFIQNGLYLKNEYNKDGFIYQRLGGRYFLKKHFVFHFALKTHFAKADYFEAGVGYYFSKKKITRKPDEVKP